MANPFRDMSVIMQALVAAAVAVVLVLVGVYLPGSPIAREREEVDQAVQKRTKLNQEVTQLQVYKQRYAELKQQMDALSKQLETLKTIVPEEKETDEFIRLLQGAASASNVQILRLTAQAVVPREYHYEMPFEVQADGPYFNVLGFFIAATAPGLGAQASPSTPNNAKPAPANASKPAQQTAKPPAPPAATKPAPASAAKPTPKSQAGKPAATATKPASPAGKPSVQPAAKPGTKPAAKTPAKAAAKSPAKPRVKKPGKPATPRPPAPVLSEVRQARRDPFASLIGRNQRMGATPNLPPVIHGPQVSTP